MPEIVEGDVDACSGHITMFASAVGESQAWIRVKRRFLFNVAVLAIVSLLVAFASYFANVLVFSSSKWVSPTDALFLEGVASVLVGFLLLLGRGGLSFWSIKAAILAAAASAVSEAETVGPSEIMRRDAWRAREFLRLGLILLLAGVFMLAGYFLTV